jgi:hypothetical protein
MITKFTTHSGTVYTIDHARNTWTMVRSDGRTDLNTSGIYEPSLLPPGLDKIQVGRYAHLPNDGRILGTNVVTHVEIYDEAVETSPAY